MRQVACIIFCLVCCLPRAYPQDKREFKRTFLDAEYFMTMEDYGEALHLYNELLKLDPENANLHFLAGACYLSIFGEKHKAIPHLEQAVLSMSTGYREGSYKERDAPREALFALARAYHINNQFDKAIENYEVYRNVMFKRHFADIEFVNSQIKSCELAKSMIAKPKDVKFMRMGGLLNPFVSGYNPVVSENDSSIIYMTDKPFYRAIMSTSLGAGGWSEPEVINEELGSDGDTYPTSLSSDGRELYLVKKDYMNSDVYVSHRENGKWSVMEKLNQNINTKYYESHASISVDGTKLLFTSDRPGGQGALDIWMSERSRDGEWGPAVNMGPKINSFYNEETPFFTGNGSEIFFSSQGHATMGGFDIFSCEKLPDGSWSFPENIGYPVNSADDDLFYVPRSNGWRGYFSTIYDSISTDRNIYAIRFNPPEDVQIAFRRQEVGPGTEPEPKLTSVTDSSAAGPAQSAANTSGQVADTVSRGIVPGPVEPGEYFILNSIMFAFDSDSLNENARSEADRVYEILRKYPEIELELTGHTDAVGPDRYNLELSFRRARSVAGYLAGRGIAASRLHVTGVGESNPIAINVYEDGTDSPEGRRLNRHVSLKFLNLQDERVKVADIFVPDELRPRSEKGFTILLVESETPLDTVPEEVSGEKTALIITDESFLYTAGNFTQKDSAMKYLNEVVDKGYPDAGMLERIDLERLIADLSGGNTTVSASYTIQIMALKNPVEVSYFKPLEGVVMYSGNDGLHRYVYGTYQGIEEALKVLPSIKEMGYKDAFIMSILRYRK